MCRKVIEHHGGRIWLDENTNGDGATFHFTLPVVESAPEEHEEDPVSERTTT
jgi:signal transduction histidine kinase